MKLKLLALLLFACPLQAYDLSLEWDPSPSEDAVSAYNIYEKVTVPGSIASNYVKVGTVAAPTTVVNLTNVTKANHVYVCTATNAAGESEYSAELLVSPPPGPPGRLRIKFKAR